MIENNFVFFALNVYGEMSLYNCLRVKIFISVIYVFIGKKNNFFSKVIFLFLIDFVLWFSKLFIVFVPNEVRPFVVN